MTDSTAGTRWAREPHVRVGDPCYWCGVPMVPASRSWWAGVIPDGYRIHGSWGLCRRCYRHRRTDPEIAALMAQLEGGRDD